MLSRPHSLCGFFAAALLCCFSLVAAHARADAAAAYSLEISDEGFTPVAVHVPAGQKVQLHVTNVRKLPSEFESFALNREKIVPPGGSITVWIGPLKPGRYSFFDDFNPGKTGEVVVERATQENSDAQ